MTDKIIIYNFKIRDTSTTKKGREWDPRSPQIGLEQRPFAFGLVSFEHVSSAV